MINNAGDTTLGLVKYRGIKSTGQLVSFKSSTSATAVDYPAIQLIGFGLNTNEHYVSVDLSSNKELQGTFFMKVLVRGRATLYNYKSHFVIEKGEQYTLLPKEDVDDITPQVLRRNNLRLLGTAVSDCNKVIVSGNVFKITSESLSTIINDYNGCVGAESTVYSYRPDAPLFVLQWGASLGLNISKLGFTSEDILPIHTAEFDPVSSLSIGGELFIEFPRYVKNFGLLIAAYYQKTEYYGFSRWDAIAPSGINVDANIETNMIRFHLGPQYQRGWGDWEAFIRAGFAGIVYSNPSSSLEVHEFQRNVAGTISTDILFSDPRYFQSGLGGGAFFGFGAKKRISNNWKVGVLITIERTTHAFISDSDTNNFQLHLLLSK